MRKLVAATLAACLLLCGCGGGNGIVREDNTPKENVGGRFICDNNTCSFDTVVDSKTGVTYLVWRDGFVQDAVGGITVLLNDDGTPVISEEVSR